MFPRSPTWRAASVGAPCVFPKGLKCDPAEAQPEDRSPPALSTESGAQDHDLSKYCSLDVEAPLRPGVKALQFAGNCDFRARSALGEGHRATCTMIALEYRHGLADIEPTEQVHIGEI